MSRRPADITQAEQNSSHIAPVSPLSDKKHLIPLNPLRSVSSVQPLNSSDTDPKPVSCNWTNSKPPPSDTQCATQSVSSTFVLQLPEDDLKKEQQQDPALSEVLNWKAKGQKPPYWHMKKCTPAEKVLWQEYQRLTLHNGLLCRKVFNPSTKSVLHQVVVPHALKETGLQLLHGNPVTFRMSADKVLKRA